MASPSSCSRFHSANILITVEAQHQGTKKGEHVDQLLFVQINAWQCSSLTDFCLGIQSPAELFASQANPCCIGLLQHLLRVFFYTSCAGSSQLTNKSRQVRKWGGQVAFFCTLVCHSFCHHSYPWPTLKLPNWLFPVSRFAIDN